MADDSATTPQETTQAEPEKPSGPLVCVTPGPGGCKVTRYKDESGKFVKAPKPMPSAREVMRNFHTFIHGKDGDLTKLQRMQLALYNLVKNPPAREASASVKAAELLLRYTYGEKLPNSIEVEEGHSSSVKIVVIGAPQNMLHPAPVEERLSKPTQPSFAEVLEVRENKPPDMT